MSLKLPFLRSAPAPAPERAPADSLLGAAGLRKRYGRKEAVADVSLEVRSGEIVGLLGPNGAGKTTVFYSIVGFIKPTEGDVVLDGASIVGLPMYRRSRMGIAYLPQETSIFRKLSVEKNVWSIVETRTDLARPEKKAKLEALLEEFGLADAGIRRRLPHTLSGGEKRRTEIARSLAKDPKFLLLDEPFTGIDPKAISEIKAIILKLAAKGIGILITDHNAYELLSIITRGYVIHEGQVVFAGEPSEISRSEIVRSIYLGADFQHRGSVAEGMPGPAADAMPSDSATQAESAARDESAAQASRSVAEGRDPGDSSCL